MCCRAFLVMHSPAYSRVNLGIPLRARRTLESHLFLARGALRLLRSKLLRYARAQGYCFASAHRAPPRFLKKAPALLSGVNALSAPAGFGNLKGTRFCALRARSRGWARVSPRASLFRLQKRSVLAQGSRCFSPCARSAFCAPLPCSPLRPFPASAPTAGALAKNCACACFGSGGVFPAPAVSFGALSR